MRCTIVAGLFLAVALVIAKAGAQEPQWRTSTPNQNSQSGPVVGLRPPVADSAPVQQTSHNAAWSSAPMPLPWPTSADQTPQPMPQGPPLQAEKGPAPKPLTMHPAPNLETIPPDAVFRPSTGPVYGVPPGLVGEPCGPYNDGVVGGPNGCDCGGIFCGWFHGNNCDPCGMNCDPCCDGCCAPRDCFWIRGEYLLWTVKGASHPPLVTTNGIPGSSPVIGVPGTVVAYGGSRDDFNIRSGGRFTIGFAFPCTCNDFGFESTYFFLGDRATSATFSSEGNPSIGRPFTNVGPVINGFPGNQDAELVAFPGVVVGSVNVRTSNQLWGAEGNFRMPIACGCLWKVDFLTGFRYVQFDEDLQISENLNVLGSGSEVPLPRAGNIVVVDRFDTRNQFYGGQIGVDAECRWRRWFVGGTGKLALGGMHQTVGIDGATTFSDGPAGTERGGLLAQNGTNIGNYSRDSFAVIPELGLRLGFYFTEHFRGFVGYDVIYISNVVRPGDQIDLNVNPTFLPRNGPAVGAPLPRFQHRPTDFWAQGVSFGLELRF